ncbi:hypothetical protein SOCEGT47_021470 [Sorangium cellulosum]|uniref:Uncharacterized protein n=1 Tax=Sorangium cellulosum TaxID=56 RepID=A0A4P2PY11_SORCE|nr:hypothetical protein [Sorangium cellulosum]AUX21660.1 hypothetical protein SOCEGT47_021470 [Sorangium cellulosum]
MKLAYPFTLAVALAMLPGCGSTLTGLCEDKCDCTGACSPDDEDDCIDNLEDAERAAIEEGCEDQFDEAIACMDDEFECRGRSIDVDGCSRPLENLSSCAGLDVRVTLWAALFP